MVEECLKWPIYPQNKFLLVVCLAWEDTYYWQIKEKGLSYSKDMYMCMEKDEDINNIFLSCSFGGEVWVLVL